MICKIRLYLFWSRPKREIWVFRVACEDQDSSSLRFSEWQGNELVARLPMEGCVLQFQRGENGGGSSTAARLWPYFALITSLAMVANCMFEVPS